MTICPGSRRRPCRRRDSDFMKQGDLGKQAEWYWVLLLGVVGIGLVGFSLFLLNREIALPASWAVAGGPRDGVGDVLNALVQALLLPLTATAFGVLIIRKQPHHRIGRLLIAIGFVSAIAVVVSEWAVRGYYPVERAVPGAPLAAWITNWLWIIVISLVFLLVGLFPSGSFLSGRWRTAYLIPAAVLLVTGLIGAGAETTMSSAFQIANPYIIDFPANVYDVLFAMIIAAMGVITLVVLAQTVARFRLGTGVEREQLKWLVAGAAVFALMVIVGIQLSIGRGSAIGAFIVNAAALAPLMGIGIAMVRHQLYDIDFIIRRTTSYAVVTGLLVMVYFGTVVLLQRLFTGVTGQTSTVAVVLSTLLIAALFLPLRRRVQDVVDRRFFRQKYDAEQVLNRFAATVRDETDLDELTAELARVIQDTMQPEFVSVWLAPTEHDDPLRNV